MSLSASNIKNYFIDLFDELLYGPGFKKLIHVLKSPIGIIGTLFLIISLTLPFLTNTASWTDILWWVFFYIAIAESWNIIGGYAGEVDFGHVLFVAFGIYVVGITYQNFFFLGFLFGNSFNFFGLPFGVYLWMVIEVVIAGIVSAVVAILIGIPTLRLRGAYFAVTLLAFNEVLKVVFNYPNDITHGGEGVNLPRILNLVPQLNILVYFAIIAVSIASFLLTHYISYTRLGLNLRAIRDNQEGASAMGINVLRTKVIAYAMSGFLAGMAGAIYMLRLLNLTPTEAFDTNKTVEMIIITLLGGPGSVFGPILGALIIVPIKFQLPVLIGQTQFNIFGVVLNFDVIYLVIYGIIFILAVLFLPKGIIGYLQDKGYIKRETLIDLENE